MTRMQRGTLLAVATTGVVAALINCSGDTNSPPQKSDGETQITVTPAATGLDTPLDAAPDPMGTDVYFLAGGASGVGVYHVAAAGGAASLLYSGPPLVDPHGVAVSSDGKTLFIADRGAGSGGAIFSMPVSGDTPVAISGSEGTHPSALDAVEIGTSNDLYFTGANANGDASIYKLAAEGGTAEVLASGAPLAKPDGIAVASDLTVYVADQQAGTNLPGQVFKVSGGSATAFGPELKPGNPTGIAITLDDTKVLVSSLDSAGNSEVTILAAKDGTASTFDDVIKENTVSGGLHRAKFRDIYAWAGKTQVYSIRIKTILADSSTPGGVGNR